MASEKLKFEAPKLEVIRLSEEDIITSSGDWREPAELEEIPD